MLVGAGISTVGGAFGKVAAVIIGILCIVAGIAVLVWPGKKHKDETASQKTLKERTVQLANELFAFLKKQGPEPPNPLSNKGTIDEQRRALDVYFDWKKETYFKYMAYYKDRVVKIDYELAANGLFTGLYPREIDPPSTSQEVDVKKIAEALLLTGSRMPEIEKLLLRLSRRE
jgi:type II secretory pathway pseudopilin PulG